MVDLWVVYGGLCLCVVVYGCLSIDNLSVDFYESLWDGYVSILYVPWHKLLNFIASFLSVSNKLTV